MIRGWTGSPLDGCRCLGSIGWMVCVVCVGSSHCACLLRRSTEAGIHGVPIRPWILNRIRDGAVRAPEGVVNPPKSTAPPPPVLPSVCVPKQAVPLVYDVLQERRGIRGLTYPIFLTPIQLAVRGQCATITLEEAPRRVRMTCNTRRRTVTKGTHLLRSALLALLALAVLSGGSLAAGDLFDNGYKDCPHKTRLRDGQIDRLVREPRLRRRGSRQRCVGGYRSRDLGSRGPTPTAHPS